MTTDCTRTLEAVPTAHLTGFSTRAAAALVHLREAWIAADHENRRHVVAAIAALLESRSFREPSSYADILLYDLDPTDARQLELELERLATGPADVLTSFPARRRR